MIELEIPVLGCLVVDLESGGVDPLHNDVVEISWWALNSGECATFIPPHSPDRCTPAALAINKYYERELYRRDRWDHDNTQLKRFHRALTGQVLVGAKPWFDESFLRPLFTRHGLDPTPWDNSSPQDIGTYAMGVFGWPIGARPSLGRLAKILGVPFPDHSAQGDVDCTGRCLLELQRIIHERKKAA